MAAAQVRRDQPLAFSRSAKEDILIRVRVVARTLIRLLEIGAGCHEHADDLRAGDRAAAGMT